MLERSLKLAGGPSSRNAMEKARFKQSLQKLKMSVTIDVVQGDNIDYRCVEIEKRCLLVDIFIYFSKPATLLKYLLKSLPQKR